MGIIAHIVSRPSKNTTPEERRTEEVRALNKKFDKYVELFNEESPEAADAYAAKAGIMHLRQRVRRELRADKQSKRAA